MKVKWPAMTQWAWSASVGGALVAAVLAGAWPSNHNAEPSKIRALAARSVLVSNTNDNGPGSLRSALQDANGAPGATIQFAIPRTDRGFANGTWTIAPLSALPTIIAANTQIDGSSQTTFGGNTNLRGPEIEIRGDRSELSTPTPTATSTPSAGPTPSPPVGSTPTPPVGSTPTPPVGSTPTPGLSTTIPTDGLIFNAANGVLRGVTINRFSGNGVTISGPAANGVRIEGCFIGTDAAGKAAAGNRNAGVHITKGATNTVIGGATLAARNVMASNGRPNSSFGLGNIVVLSGKCRIQGNYLGTDAGGTTALSGSNISVPNIFVSSSFPRSIPTALIIGGSAPGEGNLISGGSTGVSLSLSDSSATVQGNRIGTDASGTRAVPNSVGIGVSVFGKASCLIGGPGPGARNIISGNRFNDLNISNSSTTAPGRGVVVQNNFIGPNAVGTPISNTLGEGIRIFGSGHVVGAAVNDPAPLSKGNQITGHAIGVALPSFFLATGNVIRGNAIFGNQRQNINLRGDRFDLLNIPNDPLDADTGPNRRQNYPVLAFARQSTSLVVGGALGSTPGRAYVLDFYRSDRPGVGGQGEGRTWIGAARVTTDRQGNVAFSSTISGRLSGYIAATATDATTQDTSEFSPALLVSSGPAPLRAPVITNFSPYKVAPGGIVTVNGVNLGTTRAARIGTRVVTFKVLSAAQVQLTAPNEYLNAPIVLTTDAGVAISATNLIVASPNDNDFFVFATPLRGSSGSLGTGTADATSEPGEPAHGGVGSGHSRWFRWTTPTDGEAIVQVSNASFDSVLAVYTGSSVDRLQLVATNDDASTSSGGSGSRVTFSAQAGQTYYIAVDSVRDTFGYCKFEWQLSRPPLRTRGDTPALSSAHADAATQSIRLTFRRPLAATVASDWTVEVNGQAVAIESLAGAGNQLTLGLPEGTLRRGDRVVVRWKAQRVADLIVGT